MPTLPPEERQVLMRALLDAFPDWESLESMIFLYLGGSIDDYGGARERRDAVIRRLIMVAESRHTVSRLISASRAANPDNPLLTTAAGTLAPASAPGSGFEVLLNRANAPVDIAVLLARLGQIEGQVGRVEYETPMGPKPIGTAFLVAPDLVLTNDHVIAHFNRGIAPDQGRIRFDYKLLSDSASLSPGRSVRFAAGEWLLDRSPPSARDGTSVAGDDPDPGELDYALVRLAEPIGDQPRGPAGGQAGPPRGWLAVSPPFSDLVPDSTLWIMQHPEGTPLKLAFADRGIERVNGNRTRFRHRVNTQPGASGSPCFDSNLALVGVHHYGTEDASVPYNQAIPIANIRERLHKNGHTTVLI